MRYLFFGIFITIVFCTVQSCQKDLPYHVDENGNIVGDSLDTSTSPKPGDTATIAVAGFTKMVQGTGGTGLYGDTVYYVTYNSSKLVQRITDSAYADDSLVATYDSAMLITRIRHYANAFSGFETYNFTYDSKKRLIEIDDTFIGQPEKTVYEYSDSTSRVPAKKSYYIGTLNAGASTLALYRTFNLESSNGDITKITAFDPSGAQAGTPVKYTYSPTENVFQNLSLFNIGNYIGFEEIMPLDAYFNKHLILTYSSDSQSSNAYSFDSQSRITGAVTTFLRDSSAYTRKFYY